MAVELPKIENPNHFRPTLLNSHNFLQVIKPNYYIWCDSALLYMSETLSCTQTSSVYILYEKPSCFYFPSMFQPLFLLIFNLLKATIYISFLLFFRTSPLRSRRRLRKSSRLSIPMTAKPNPKSKMTRKMKKNLTKSIR